MKILINDMLISPSWGPSSSLSHSSRGGFCSCRNFTRWNGIQIFTHWQFDRLWQYKNNLQVEWTSSWVSGNHHIYLWQPGRWWSMMMIHIFELRWWWWWWWWWWYIDFNWGDGFTRCTCPWTALDSPIHPRLRLKNLNIHGWSFFYNKNIFFWVKSCGQNSAYKEQIYWLFQQNRTFTHFWENPRLFQSFFALAWCCGSCSDPGTAKERVKISV